MFWLQTFQKKKKMLLAEIKLCALFRYDRLSLPHSQAGHSRFFTGMARLRLAYIYYVHMR